MRSCAWNEHIELIYSKIKVDLFLKALFYHILIKMETVIWGRGGSRGGARPPPPPPYILDQTEVRRAEKKFILRLPPPPPPYLRVWIKLPVLFKISPMRTF